ncbi:UDP-glycosyltransferase 92A1 [Sesamum angolense]|uniref:Glycosyltransferase n=1 Tax=Sesamum angolense TaxID=2727404 RepID=A0AAE2BJS2_9LAMI|nr:UDP-glycosyltransferase 92A1 [Sesamum angolense]
MESRKEEHIVMLPFMAQGHLIPFLALANQIQGRYGFKITIATTPLNLRYLKAAISKNSNSTQIHLFELPFNSCDHGLPPNTENTEALPLNQIASLFHASASLELPFRGLIQDVSVRDGSPPLCIISDVFMGWATEVAKSCGTANITFTTGGAYGTAAYVSLWQHLPHRGRDKDEFNLPGFPDSCTFHITQLHHFLRAADGTDYWSRFFQPQIGHSLKSFGWLCNTAEEIEPFGLDVLRRYTELPVWCIGPLLPPCMLSRNSSRVIGQHTGREPGVSPEKCLEWLDLHEEKSVLYISFGSQNTISSSQMMALALGLEDSKKPFVWVIRPPVGFNLRGEFKSEWLPPGFEERMGSSNQGLVVHGWAPQLEILCHKSIAAFLSHCGWNSIMESLSQGVPIIGWPLAAEQGYNAKLLVEEMAVCVEITRGVESSISRDEVREVIERVMGGGHKAEEMKKKAGEIGELIRAALSEEGTQKGSSHRAMDDFVSALLTNKQGLA